jgi:hypothetical protein
MELLKDANQRELNKSLDEFENRITHPKVVAELVQKKNELRLRNNERALTEQEAIDEARAEIKTRFSGEIINSNTIVTALEKLKKEGRVSEKLPYDEFRQILIVEQEQFCPDEKPISAKEFFETIFPK